MHYEFNDLRVAPDVRTVCRGDERIHLPQLSFDLLITLLEVSPKHVTATELSEKIWQGRFVSDETIAQRVALLRKALNDDPKSPVYIRTLRGKGYVLVGKVELVESGADNLASSGLKKVSALAATLLILAGGGWLGSQWGHSQALFSPVTTKAKTENDKLLARAQQFVAVHQKSDNSRAIQLLRRVLHNQPNSVEGRLTLSFALTNRATKFGGQHEDTLEAESLARALLREEPANSNVWSALAHSLDAQGRIEESLSAYQMALQLNPDNAPAMSSAAYLNLIRGNLFQALAMEQRAILNGGTSRYSEVQIALCLDLLDHPDAGVWYDKAATLNPGQVVVLSELARSHIRRGTPQQANAILSQLDDAALTTPKVLQLRARIALMLGDKTQAKALWKASGKQGLYQQAAMVALTSEEHWPENLLTPDKLVDIEANTWPGLRVSLAELSAALGREDQALRFLAQAVNLGWRDLGWLTQSPFLSEIMGTERGRQLAERIGRELEAQSLLIDEAAQLNNLATI